MSFYDLLVFLMVADMVLKSTGDDVGVLIVGAAIVALVVVWGAMAIRRGPAPRAAAEVTGA